MMSRTTKAVGYKFHPRCEVFFSREFEGTKGQILSCLWFIEAQLHLRYLGLHLIYGNCLVVTASLEFKRFQPE